MKKEIPITAILIIIIAVFTTQTSPYLRHFDPWYHYRIAEYTLEQGTRPSFDPLSNMGEKIIYPPLLHYLLALPAHIPGVSLLTVAQLYPMLAGGVALIFLFLFARELFDERTALLSALLLSLIPAFKATTYFGYCDHDALDYVFILSAFFFFVKAIKKEEQPSPPPSYTFGGEGWVELPKEKTRVEEKPKFLYYALAGLSAALFALTWLGFPMLVIMLCSFMLLCSFLHSRMKLLDRNMVFGFFILSATFSIIAAPWYGAELIPISALCFFSAAFSYLSIKIEKNKNATLILLALILLLSVPPLLLFRSWIVEAGLTYIGLRERGMELEYVAELQTPDFYYISQNYGNQLLPFLLGLGVFLTYQKEFKRETVFLLTCFVILLFLASSAIRFLQYFGFFVSIFAAYFLNRLSETITGILKKDAFIPVMLLSAFLLLPLPILFSSISDEWYSSLTWLKENSPSDAVVLNWWDYSPWINAVAERKTVVNNQPPGRLQDSITFFGTDSWEEAKKIIRKYNVSYVIVNRGLLTKIKIAENFMDEKITFQISYPVKQGNLYLIKFSNKFTTYYNPVSGVAWDEYPGGRKVYYKEIGVFNQQTSQIQYFKTNLPDAELTDDFLCIFSDASIRIPSETRKRVFFNLMFTQSEIPFLELVREEGEVRIYRVK
ncbi:MAG: STT3 domain-containing protein [Candidatus Micrarchaeia archaeon]